MKGFLGRLTYANVMATVAVFIALGGVGYAAVKLPKNSVGARQLKKGAVTPAKISAGAKSGLVGPSGPAGPKGDAGPRGPSNAYYAFNLDEVEKLKTISLNVPPGNYAVTASMVATNREQKEGRVGCNLFSPGDRTHEGSAVANVPKEPIETIVGYQELNAETVLSLGGGGTIEFECGNYEGKAKVSLYDARITAVAVGSISG
jgi:hypothetical protein